jgi:segregation and condensation protein B
MSRNSGAHVASALDPLVEALLFAADRPLSVERIAQLLVEEGAEADAELKQIVAVSLASLRTRYLESGIELVEVASGFRFQVREKYSDTVARLWEERPQKYSRALLETLALIAYRQPITRGDIEEIRGVAVSSNIIKTLLEREWVRVVGHREVPGRPAIFATTRAFLDYFNLKSLDQLPTLAQMRDLNEIERDVDATLQFEGSGAHAGQSVDDDEIRVDSAS